MGPLVSLLVNQIILGPFLLSGLKMLIDGLFGWLATRQAAATSVALGQQTARADRLAAEAAANREFEDAKDELARLDLDARRERLRRTLGRGADPDNEPAR